MNFYVRLAKAAVENYVAKGRTISPPSDLPPEFFGKKAGTFVTIEEEGELRGCIGTYLPTKDNIAEEIISNAIAAAMEDYRFGPVRNEELSRLFYAVYILGMPELVKSPKELDPRKYGIIVKTTAISLPDGADVTFDGHVPFKTGLLLPDLEGVDTVAQQIAIACQKGGIDPKTERILIYRFTAEKFREGD